MLLCTDIMKPVMEESNLDAQDNDGAHLECLCGCRFRQFRVQACRDDCIVTHHSSTES